MNMFPEHIRTTLVKDRHAFSLDVMENLERCKTDAEYLGDVMLVNEKLIWHSIHKYIGKPETIARNYALEKDDIFQLGRIGFLKAMKAFDTKRGVRFSSFAVTAIVREVNCFLRDSARMIRPTRTANDLINKIRRVERELSYLPKAEELAVMLDAEVEDVTKALTLGRQVVYLDEPCRNGGPGAGVESDSTMLDLIEDQARGVEQEVVERVYLQSIVEVLRGQLNDLEVRVLELRLGGLNQTQIAEKEGLSQMRVSRMMKKILKQCMESDVLRS